MLDPVAFNYVCAALLALTMEPTTVGDLVEIVDLCRIGVRLCAGADQCRHGGIGMSPIIPWCSRDRLSHGRRCLGQPNGRTSAGRITPSACSPGRALSTPPPQSLVCPRLAAFRGHTRTPDEGQCRMRRRLQPRMLGQRRYVDRERNIDALLPHRGTVPGFIGVQVLETSCCNGHRLRCFPGGHLAATCGISVGSRVLEGKPRYTRTGWSTRS